jgi:release factor glutamine methyltransferase
VPPSPPEPAESAIVGRLRAAGCVFAEDEARLLVSSATTAADLEAMVERRVAGLPLEHILGFAEFGGLRILLEPGVFVPRRRTEFLVRQAAALARPGAIIVDLCCGSGAVGAALLAEVDRAQVHAADLDPVAARCARRNLAGRGSVYEGDLYEPLPLALRGRVDILVANAPYVPTEAIRLMPPEARLHEPRMALDGGVDGLAVLRRVIAAAPVWLAPGGHLLFESGERQAPRAIDILAAHGLVATICSSAELAATVLVAGLPPIRSGIR